MKKTYASKHMLTGCYSAIITPFDEGGKLDTVALDGLLRFYKDQNCNKVVVLGTTGERTALTEKEQETVMRMAIDAELFVIVASGCNCTERSVKRTILAKDLGAKGILAIVPYCNRPPIRGIIQHFAAISKVGLPVILYYHPMRTGVWLSVEELVVLSEIQGIAGIKDCSGDLVFAQRLMEAVKIPVFCGDDELTLEMLKLGAKGAISVVSNAIPSFWNEMVEYGLKGAWSEAEALEKIARPFIEALSLEVNPIGIKCALNLLGHCKPYLRLPLCPALEESQKHIGTAIKGLLQAFAAVKSGL